MSASSLSHHLEYYVLKLQEEAPFGMSDRYSVWNGPFATFAEAHESAKRSVWDVLAQDDREHDRLAEFIVVHVQAYARVAPRKVSTRVLKAATIEGRSL